MKHFVSKFFCLEKGFTLIESIMVLVILGIASIGIASITSSIFEGEAENRDLQRGVKELQTCAEQILATRRMTGYAAALAVGCSGLTITPSTPASPPCPTGGTCRVLQISSTATNAPAPITLMLVN